MVLAVRMKLTAISKIKTVAKLKRDKKPLELISGSTENHVLALYSCLNKDLSEYFICNFLKPLLKFKVIVFEGNRKASFTSPSHPSPCFFLISYQNYRLFLPR